VAIELYDLIAIFSVLGMISGLLLFGIIRFSGDKKAKKSGSDGVKEMYGVYTDQVRDIIKLKDNHIKRLIAEIQNNSPDSEEEPETAVKYEDLGQLASKIGIDPALLNNPLVKKYIKKYTKNMSIEEILALVNQFKSLTGNKGSKPQLENVTQDNANYF